MKKALLFMFIISLAAAVSGCGVKKTQPLVAPAPTAEEKAISTETKSPININKEELKNGQPPAAPASSAETPKQSAATSTSNNQTKINFTKKDLENLKKSTDSLQFEDITTFKQ